ncbi:hypothetical protein MMC10_002761 [Thelotrema lepadinum]|nr:hypothetical protein [Thelotrema lepadinum]
MLVSAYGKRVPKIIQSPDINPEGISDIHGPFQPFVGADATAIWAAATSGAAAISVYLLACLIARAWGREEAISLWVELVAERKKAILESFSKNNVISEASIHSTQQDIRREELDTWDASARSWLRSADEAKQREQDQAMLILKNVNLHYPPGPSTYEKVLRTWREALSSMENMLEEKPQSILNGSVPLAIMSWHLYPDMIVLGRNIKHVQLNDPLFPRTGTCTIGLEGQPGSDDFGTSWSLTLSHMTFYGGPKTVHCQDDFSRINNDQFLIAILGSLLGAWRVTRSGILPATLWIQDLWQVFQNTDLGLVKCATAPSGLEWLRNLARAAETVSQAFHSNDARMIQLVNFARRRGRGLLAEPDVENSMTPFFGLSNSLVPIALAEKIDVECGVRYLRETAAELKLKEGEAIIVSLRKGGKDAPYFEIATAIRMTSMARKRDSEGLPKSGPKHSRWLVSPAFQGQSYRPCIYHSSSSRHRQNLLSHAEEEIFDWTCDQSCGDFDALDTFTWTAKSGFYPNTYPFQLPLGGLPSNSGPGRRQITFRCLEQKKSLAIFIRADAFKASEHTSAFRKILKTVVYPAHGLDNHLATIVPARLYDYFASFGHSPESTNATNVAPGITLLTDQCSFPEPCLQSMYAASLVYDLYSELSFGTIAMALITSQKPLNEARWFRWASHIPEDQDVYFRRLSLPKLSCITARPLSRKAAFACLVHLETGKIDISDEHFLNVFAVSVDNSIFVSRLLLMDPADEVPAWSLQRIAGNIGHSGISLMVGVKDPQVRTPGDDHSIVQHTQYDFHRVNSYKSTSLHLSFTGWSVPVNLEDENLTARTIDHTISYIESVVSVRDRGRWVADLDMLSTMNIAGIPKKNPSPCTDVAHQSWRNVRLSYVSIDDWEELLDPPLESYGIFRAKGNWAARLAAVSIVLSNKSVLYDVHLIGQDFCLVCWERNRGMEPPRNTGPCFRLLID